MRAKTLFAAIFAATVCSAAPPEVAVVKPIEKEITDFADFTGRTEPSTSVEIRARVSSYLEKVLFKEGSQVKKGDLLFQLDDRVQKAALAKAEAEIKVAEAKFKIAEINLQRLMQLLKQAAIAKEEVEMAQANMEAAKAEVNAARASLEVARLNLEYTRIASPINGRIGRSNVDAGNLVKADGDTALATVIVTDPLFVSFNIDERTLLQLIRINRDKKDAKVKVAVGFGDDKDYPHQPVVDFVDNKLDTEKGTIRARAVMDNPKGDLLPGMFARVRITLGEPRKALLVPNISVFTWINRASGGQGYGVMVVDEKNTVKLREVKRGSLHGTMREIEAGLTTADRVSTNPNVSEGKEVTPVEEKATPDKKPGGDGGAFTPRPLPDIPIQGPALIITANYPGANAHTVEETVAGPISKQIDGMEGLVHQFATCTDAGDASLTLVLRTGTDLNAAQVLAQNRVALSLPALPEAVNRQGITVKKRTVNFLSVAVLSPNDSRDRQFVAAYAEERLKDELGRVAGVGAVTFYGETSPAPQVRIEYDRARLAVFGLTIADAMRAVQAETSPSALVRPGVTIADRPKSVEEIGNVVVKATNAHIVRLKDVARLDEVAVWNTTTTLDGKPCVILLVSRAFDADARETAKAVRERLKKLQESAPEGLEMRVIDE